MLTGLVADAVTMPAALGRLVLGDLRIAMLSGPVVAEPSGLLWMFLTAPIRDSACQPTGGAAAGELSRLDVKLVPTGTYVVLPRHLGEATASPWIEGPTPQRGLPPLPAVIATARRNGFRLHQSA
jgi:hypothetical protein